MTKSPIKGYETVQVLGGSSMTQQFSDRVTRRFWGAGHMSELQSGDRKRYISSRQMFFLSALLELRS